MSSEPTIRSPRRPGLRSSSAATLLFLALSSASAQTAPHQPAPIERRPPPPGASVAHPSTPQSPHLQQWLDNHRGMSLAEQQAALDREPGFHNLPPEQQQRIHNQLSTLSQMDPQQQRRTLNRTETMERLLPEQRQQIRSALGQVAALPEPRRRAVSREFYALQNTPEPRRSQYMSSGQFRSEFNDQERGAINGLLNVAPIYPPLQPRPTPPPQ